MSGPEILHEREHGGTTDHNRIRVSLRRKAVLTDDLRDVVDRRDAVIFVTTNAGMVPSHRFGIQPEQAVRLIEALRAALADWHDVQGAEQDADVDAEHLFVRDLRRNPNGEVRLYVGDRLVSGTIARQILPDLAVVSS